MILFKIIRMGFGGRATPVATMALQDSDLIDCGEKRRTLLGAKTIGQYIVAIAG
jgi:hypothetical protein